jgi:hypothetical protein
MPAGATGAISNLDPPSLPQVGRGRRRQRRRGTEGDAFGGSVRTSSMLLGLLAIVVVGSVLAAGTVHVEVLLAVAPFALATGVLLLYRERELSVPRPAWVLFGLAAYCVLQAIPLPLPITRLLNPAGAAIWIETLTTLGESPRVVSLSLDPGASLVEALKWLCYGSVMARCSWLPRTSRAAEASAGSRA